MKISFLVHVKQKDKAALRILIPSELSDLREDTCQGTQVLRYDEPEGVSYIED
jgi:hypothetical protein